MLYDPIKDWLGGIFTRHPWLQKVFYRLLDLFFLRSWYVRREVVALLKHAKNGHVLDAGTGFGQYAYFIARTFPQVEVTAVDIKEDYLARAEAFFQRVLPGRVHFRRADLTRLDLPEETYDLILSVDVMEHIEEDEAVFRHFYRVLKPGGVVLINTPSDQGGSDVHREGESFIGEHVREGYGREELEEKLRRAGLEPFRTRYTYGPAGSLAWRMLIKWPMRMLNTGRWLAPVVLLYYVPVFPVGMFLNWLDMQRENERGTGLLVLARKPDGASVHSSQKLD